MRGRSEGFFDQGEGLGWGLDLAFELGVFSGAEHLFEGGSGDVAGGDQFPSRDQKLRADGDFGHGLPAIKDVVVVVEVAAGGHRVHAMELEVLGE